MFFHKPSVQLCRMLTILLFAIGYSYGLWEVCQDASSRGKGNVGFAGYLTVPVYLSSDARNRAITEKSHEKFKTYGGYLQFGATPFLDIGIHGNTSINSSVGLHLKFAYNNRFNFATIFGVDYIFQELLLAPSGVIMGSKPLKDFLSVYSGLKTFYWQNMVMREDPRTKKDVFGLLPLIGFKVFNPKGWGKGKLYSSLPTGIYLEFIYPVNIEPNCFIFLIGLEGFRGISLRGFPLIR